MCDYNHMMINAINSNKNDGKWANAPFEGIKLVSNTAVGSVGQTFVRNVCDALGIDNEPPVTAKGKEAYNSPWDLKIKNVTFEIKTASEDTRGRYQFNHVRLHREYHAMLCIGISPDNIYFQVWTKAQIATGGAGKLTSMEKGGASDFKLSKSKSALLPIENFEATILSFIENNF